MGTENLEDLGDDKKIIAWVHNRIMEALVITELMFDSIAHLIMPKEGHHRILDTSIFIKSNLRY